jgi:hypothetical protein
MDMMQDFALLNPPESYTSLRLLSALFPGISGFMQNNLEQNHPVPRIEVSQKKIHNNTLSCTEQRLQYASQGGSG